MSKWTFFMIVLTGILIAWLASQAAAGNIAAWVIIAVITTVVLMLAGAMIHHAGAKLAAHREQNNFAANAMENMNIMRMMIAAQNAQLTGALRSQQLHNTQPEPNISTGGYPALPPAIDAQFTIEGLDEEEVENRG